MEIFNLISRIGLSPKTLMIFDNHPVVVVSVTTINRREKQKWGEDEVLTNWLFQKHEGMSAGSHRGTYIDGRGPLTMNTCRWATDRIICAMSDPRYGHQLGHRGTFWEEAPSVRCATTNNLGIPTQYQRPIYKRCHMLGAEKSTL